jgi:transposase
VLAARAALGYHPDRLPTPRADGDREALRILLVARADLTDERTAKVNALRALLRGGDHTDAELAAGRLTAGRLAAIARRRGKPGHTREQAIRQAEARRLAHRITTLDRELATNTKTLTALVDQLAPDLLDRPGIGPVSGGQAIVSYSHHGRCRNDAAYARLAGAAPLPASSGQTIRHRLNRGGDRALNRALHHIALTRMRHCPRTRAYVQRRRAEGKTNREIRRCLKRYIARELFRALNHATALDNT